MTSTRQKMILFSILAVLASSVTAFAELCEDGQSMAESAGLSAEQKLSTGCKVNSSIELPSQKEFERWSVSLKCSSFTGISRYEVRLHPAEDGACFVSSTGLDSQSPENHDGCESVCVEFGEYNCLSYTWYCRL